MCHILTIYCLYLFSCFRHVRAKIKTLRMRLREGFDLHLIGTMKDKVKLDKGVLKSTLNMCRDEGDF
jgi:hypothetical protein